MTTASRIFREIANSCALVTILAGNLLLAVLSLLFLLLQPRKRTISLAPEVLMIAPFPPGNESGGSKAVLDLQRTLKALGRLEVYAVPKRAPGGVLERLGLLLLRPLPIPASCRRLMFGDRTIREAGRKFDVVVFEFLLTAVYLCFGRLDGQRIVIRDHEVLVRKLDMERRDSRGVAAFNWTLRLWSCWLVSLCAYSRADRIIALTQADRDAIARWFPRLANRAVYIPAPFDAPDATPLKVTASRDLMMVANFFHSPNRDGLLWFIRECAPHLEPGFTLHLCGVDGALRDQELQSPHLRIVRHGFIEDTAALAAIAPIAVAPIISGGGVRIKNLFLGSMAKTLITTPLGNEGIDFVDGVHAYVCDNGQAMAERINTAARDPERLERLGQSAREHIKTKFRQQTIQNQFRHLLNNLSFTDRASV